MKKPAKLRLVTDDIAIDEADAEMVYTGLNLVLAVRAGRTEDADRWAQAWLDAAEEAMDR